MATKKKENADMERLLLFTKQMKIRTLNADLNSFQNRQNALAMELDAIPKKAQEAQEQRDKLLEEYKQEYTTMKEAAGVPEGSELNLETGEIVKLQQQ